MRRAAVLTLVRSTNRLPCVRLLPLPTPSARFCNAPFSAVLTLDGCDESGAPDPRMFFKIRSRPADASYSCQGFLTTYRPQAHLRLATRDRTYFAHQREMPKPFKRAHIKCQPSAAEILYDVAFYYPQTQSKEKPQQAPRYTLERHLPQVSWCVWCRDQNPVRTNRRHIVGIQIPLRF